MYSVLSGILDPSQTKQKASNCKPALQLCVTRQLLNAAETS